MWWNVKDKWTLEKCLPTSEPSVYIPQMQTSDSSAWRLDDRPSPPTTKPAFRLDGLAYMAERAPFTYLCTYWPKVSVRAHTSNLVSKTPIRWQHLNREVCYCLSGNKERGDLTNNEILRHDGQILILINQSLPRRKKVDNQTNIFFLRSKQKIYL